MNFIFSQKNFVSLFWGLFNDETDLRGKKVVSIFKIEKEVPALAASPACLFLKIFDTKVSLRREIWPPVKHDSRWYQSFIRWRILEFATWLQEKRAANPTTGFLRFLFKDSPYLEKKKS